MHNKPRIFARSSDIAKSRSLRSRAQNRALGNFEEKRRTSLPRERLARETSLRGGMVQGASLSPRRKNKRKSGWNLFQGRLQMQFHVRHCVFPFSIGRRLQTHSDRVGRIVKPRVKQFYCSRAEHFFQKAVFSPSVWSRFDFSYASSTSFSICSTDDSSTH